MKTKILLTLSLLFVSLNAYALDLPGLKTLMQGLETDLTQAQKALLRQDAAALAQAAKAIASHPMVSEGERKAIQGVLKQEMGKFKQWDHQTHEAANALAQAALANDAAAQLTSFQAVVQGCVGCHQEFRQRLLK